MALPSSLLLLVDPQKDFLGRPHLQPPAGALIERAAFLLEVYRRAGLPVVHIRTTVTRDPDTRMAHWRHEGRWMCVEGSEGHQPPVSLRELNGETVIHKQGFAAPGIVEEVSRQGVKTVVVLGVMTHACVRQAVQDLFQAGFQMYVAHDAVGSDDPLHAAITRRYFEQRGVRFVSSASISAQLSGESTKTPLEPAQDLPSLVNQCAQFALKWRNVDFAQRVELASSLLKPLRDNADNLATKMAEELGKPVRFGRTEVLRSADMIEAIIRRFSVLQNPPPQESIHIRRRPHGVVAIITPWNNAIYIPLGKIIPAILAGNSVAWKPAPEATSIARQIKAFTESCGWPQGLLDIIEGDAEAGRALISQTGIDAVTITASLAAGYAVGEVCTRRHLPFQAELGGNNASIIWEDADLPLTAEKVAAGAFEMTGQRCTANRRVIVHHSIYSQFVDLLQEKTKALHWGDPLDPQTQIGPMISAAHRDRVQSVVDRATEEGCRVFYPKGKTPPTSPDNPLPWLPPILLLCDSPGSEIAQEETFGPVLVVQAARNWNEAISICNGVQQGLAAALFSHSPEIIESFLDEAKAGILKINTSTSDAMLDFPFGGWKASGTGPPEHGDSDLEFYTRIQTVYP